MNFLRKRNRITESEALARLSQTQLTQLSQLSPAELAVVRRPRYGLSVVVGALIGAAVSAREWWWPLVSRWLAGLGGRP